MYRDKGNAMSIDLDTFNMEEEIKLFKEYKPNPVQILIRLYIQAEKTKGGIILTDKEIEKDVYSNISGYVAKVGQACFSGEKYKHWGEWYGVGDWVVFPRHAGIRFEYNGLPVFSIVDDAVIAKINDPRKV